MIPFQRFVDWLTDRIPERKPDVVIGGAADPYLMRWWVIPRNRFFNVYLHRFCRSDEDRAHPWLFNASLLLIGRYREHVIERGGLLRVTERGPGAFKFRWGAAPHRIELLRLSDYVKTQPDCADPMPCWTLFITGPVVRKWGFLCMERGFIPWERFTRKDDPGQAGAGCDG